MASPVGLVVFDCDGVLFDSEPANLAFYREVLRAAGAPPIPPSAEAACHSLASAELFERMFGHDPAMLARVKETGRATDYAPFFPLMQPRPRLRETLATLRATRATAMATNRGQTTKGVLAHFDLASFFDLAVGVLEVARPKPSPDMLLLCLDTLGHAAEGAVYVGDQATDLEAATAAGMRFIGMGPMAGLTPWTAERFEDIPALVEAMERG